MNLYKEGDRCYGCNFPPSHYQFNNRFCTIEGVFNDVIFDDGSVGVGYLVVWDGGCPDKRVEHLYIGEKHFKLRRSVVERSNWNIFEKICGFNPVTHRGG